MTSGGIDTTISASADGRTSMSVDEHFEGARFQLQAPVCIVHGHLWVLLSAGRG